MAHSYTNHFSARNVPFGIASCPSECEPKAATRIDDHVIFLEELQTQGVFDAFKTSLPADVFSSMYLNAFASLGNNVVSGVRNSIQQLWNKHGISGFPTQAVRRLSQVVMHLPVEIKDFTDFSCSIYHNENMGRLIMGNPALPPCFLDFPAGYGGRSASIVLSGTSIRRPVGTFAEFQSGSPEVGNRKQTIFGPSKQMDYEVELGAIVGEPLAMQQGLDAAMADRHIFGFVIVNDWTARDIQAFEMMPFGPLNSKSVGTSISPWIVTLAALEPFAVKGVDRRKAVSKYLVDPDQKLYDISLRASLRTNESNESTEIGLSNMKDLYWSPRQTLAHIVRTGSAMRTGDLMATGTISGSERIAFGCIMEKSQGGKSPLSLSGGIERSFLMDGDTVDITALAGTADSGVGFGCCSGSIYPAPVIT